MAEALSHLLLTKGVCPRLLISLHATGYPSGRYGSQSWHQQESGLAGPQLRAELDRAVRG
jgi:transketolase